MRPEDVRRWLKFIPFLPFRMHLTDGSTFDVRHPEQVLVDRSTVNLMIPGVQTDPDPQFQRDHAIALLHIVYLEPIS